MNKRFLVILLSFVSLASFGKAQSDSLATDSIGTIVDEVIWVVGDEAILKSDVEAMRIQGQQEGLRWKGDPDCAIPEQIAVQKLYLNQAIIDSVEVTEAEITQGVEQYIENMISVIGSREKLEEYQKKTLSQIRAELRDSYRERLMPLLQGHVTRQYSFCSYRGGGTDYFLAATCGTGRNQSCERRAPRIYRSYQSW